MRLVQKRLLVATLFALVLAIVLGLTAAGMLANRLRRLEVAAERISGGDFGAPIVDRGDDEIGQLATAFDRMRVRLAQLDNARKEFVANASHELRTPLFSLGGFLELLSDEDLDDETRREFIVTMQGQMARLTKLSADLLDLSRVDAGQLSVVEEPVDLGDVARSLAAELEHVATASGHVLEVEVESDVWAAADEERVMQVGRALLVNALVHTPEGTRIVVRARRRGDRVELAIEDDGPGHRARAPGGGVRALLPDRRRRDGLGQRPRPRDRPGAGAADGRVGTPRIRAGQDGGRARAGRGASARSRGGCGTRVFT